MPDAAPAASFGDDRFLTRARTLFYARLAFLGLGLAVLDIPAWRLAFKIQGTGPAVIYLLMVGYSAINYVILDRPRLGKVVTFITLCCDLMVVVYLIAQSGGLRSPLVASQLLFTTLFVTLFPSPMAVVPPLLTFPIVAKIDDLLGRIEPADVFILLWFSAINGIVVYVLVYLDQQERSRYSEVTRLQSEVKEVAILEERNRLAREIHDGLGGALSSMIIQSEYIEGMAREADLKHEIRELRGAAEDSIEELRRALKAMHGDLDLVPAVAEWCRTASTRYKLKVGFRREGIERVVAPETTLAIFRLLQEALTNVARHAAATSADVALQFGPDAVMLSVKDDGKGFDPTVASPLGHYGLANMRERARKVGGEMRIESTPGAGSAISIIVPLRKENEIVPA